MNTTLRPLGIVMEIIRELGHEITYAYDDLVFINHSAFLLQFADDGHTLNLYFNTDCPDDEARTIEVQLVQSCSSKELDIKKKGTFSITEQEDETLSISFYEKV